MPRETPVVEANRLAGTGAAPRGWASMARWRIAALGAGVAGLVLWLAPGLGRWTGLALAADLHSHVILIPAVCAYLLALGRNELAWDSPPSPRLGAGILLGAIGLAGWAGAAGLAGSQVDAVAMDVATLVVCAWALGFGLLGRRWMRSAAFPMGFMVFMIPLPDGFAGFLEQLLMAGSAWLAEGFFRLGGVPVFRSGQVLEIPGITLHVAEACSGIRSTWVLFITSLLVGHLFLPSGLGRPALVALVVPLGIARNALRISVIGALCVAHGPEMIDGWIHRHGGPLFFAASLVPLFLLAWWLRRRAPKNNAPPPGLAG